MFRVMDISPDNILSGYFVPFRSRNSDELPRKSESISFGVGLWQEVFKRARVQTIIAFGKDTA
jgi:hypothetical protein